MARQNMSTATAPMQSANRHMTSVQNKEDLTAAEFAKRLRACSYNPEADIIDIVNSETGSVEKYLEVKFRMLWFHQYCAENNIVGFIDESDIKVIPEANLICITCKIYTNGQLVSTGIAGGILNDGRGAVQNIATAAKGRALANLGFGTITATSVSGSGELFPVDSGLPYNAPTPSMTYNRSTQSFTSVAPNAQGNPMIAPAPAPVQPNAVQPFNSGAATSQIPQASASMTLEQARNTIMPGGEFKGKSLAEIAGQQPSLISWLASDKYNGNPNVRAAAQIILNDMVNSGVWKG